MKSENWFIRLEDAADTAEIDALQAAAFGPDGLRGQRSGSAKAFRICLP